MMIFERDIAIDLGTTNIRVFVRGKGIMLREPSIVAVDKYTGRMLKVGQDAQKMLGRTPANIVAIHPISAGVISDYDMTALMLKELLSRVTSFSLFKPRVLVTVPSSVTGVEERNVIDAVIEAGARKVYLVESAVATAATPLTRRSCATCAASTTFSSASARPKSSRLVSRALSRAPRSAFRRSRAAA